MHNRMYSTCLVGVVAAAALVWGCGKNERPRWMDDRRDIPVVPNSETPPETPDTKPAAPPPALDPEVSELIEAVHDQRLVSLDTPGENVENPAEPKPIFEADKAATSDSKSLYDAKSDPPRLAPIPLDDGVVMVHAVATPPPPKPAKSPAPAKPVEKPASKLEPVSTKPSVEKPVAKPAAKPSASASADEIARLLAETSPSGKPVAYKDIQNRLHPKPVKPSSKPLVKAPAAATKADPVAPPTKPAASPRDDKEVIVAGVVLQVNDKYLSVDDILRLSRKRLAEIPRRLSENEFKRKAAELLSREIMYEVQQRLVFAEADTLMEEQAKAMVDVEMDDLLRTMIAEAGGSQAKLEQQLVKDNTTLEYELAQHRRDMLIRFYLQQKLMPAVIINRRMLWDAYKKNRKAYTTKTKMQMQIIAAPLKAFLPVGADGRPARRPSAVELKAVKPKALAQIRSAQAALDAGEDFAAVVKTYSKGPKANAAGIWPLMGEGNKREEKVEAAAFQLAQGARTGIIEEDNGYYIVRAHRVVPGKTVRFEDAQEKLEDDLRRKQFLKLRAEYLEKIYDKATISQSREFMILAVEQAAKRRS